MSRRSQFVFNAVDLDRITNLAEAARKQQQKAKRAEGRSWYRITNAADGPAEVYLFDMIGEWGVTAQDFVAEVRPLNGQPIDLHLNCEGGEVFDGLAIYAALQQHRGHVRAYIDGLAASSASFIAMAADEIVMAKRARMMIHDAHGLTVGNARDHHAMAELLDDLSANIAQIYTDRAGGTVKKWRDAMHGPDGADGTWYDAEAAVKAGLADRISDGKPEPEDSVTPKVTDAAPAPTLAWNPQEFLSMLKETTGV